MAAMKKKPTGRSADASAGAAAAKKRLPLKKVVLVLVFLVHMGLRNK